METVRGTCVSIGGHGVLLRGPSGCGKSDLALRLIEAGAELVSDDYTRVEIGEIGLMATAPEAISGLLEVRGLGVVRMQPRASVVLAAVVDLIAADDVPRMRDQEEASIAGVPLPRFCFAAFESSAGAKVRLAVSVATGSIMVVQ